VTVARDTMSGLMSRLNEARALAFDVQRLLRLRHNAPPPAPKEIGALDPDLLRFVAPTQQPVLLWGDAGAAAVSIARFIHDHSPWSSGDFLHLRTVLLKRGAIQDHLEAAGRTSGETGPQGTLYLEEITNLATEVQEELIAYLEPDHIRTSGSGLPLRLITATSRSLEGALETGGLSERLYYLLARIIVPIPTSKSNNAVPVVHRSFVTWIVSEVTRLQGSRDGRLYAHFLRLLQGSLIQVVLEKTAGNQLRAARLLGVNRNTLRKWMRLLEGATQWQG
jgi:DNA-binding NtrC family response regulator